MIPLRDVIPSRTTPFVTVTIIIVNLAVWFAELSMTRQDLDAFFRVFGVVPLDFHLSTLATSMFLHGSWWHIVGNMWYLWIFGENVEDRMGHGRFVAFYVLCGAVAALGQVTMDPESALPMIGASGAIAAVMGAYFVLYPRSRVLTLVPLIIYFEIIEIPALGLLGVWFVLQLVSASTAGVATNAASGGVAFAAHVAGFFIGAIAVFGFRRRDLPAVWH
jgi:membrane associated rhomboid family serine protease